MNKILIMDKLPKESRGSFIYTLLQGKALEIVEHLDPSEYQKEGGDAVLFALLDKRWPALERSDEMGENLTEVFSLRAKDGELLRTWCARARECFDRLERKTGVKFPEEAKGWILLNYSGLLEEQRAVVLARAGGDLKMDVQSQAMRSCFPEHVVSRRKPTAAHYVENDEDLWWSHDDYATDAADEQETTTFQDVELFLTDHQKGPDDEDPEDVFPETEVAEVLAASWKERRQELSKLQKARRFPQAAEVKRAFRVEVKELKKRTQCRRCGKTGHWARECRVKLPQGTSGSSSLSASSQLSAASYVQHFVRHAVSLDKPIKGMLEQLRERRLNATENVFLVSSPGYAILDSGCGKSVIGEKTLTEFRKLWTRAGLAQPTAHPEVNVFRFGNGAQETSNMVIELPVCLAGRRGLVRAAIIQGTAPLLLSRPALKTLRARMNFETDEIYLFDSSKPVPLDTNEAGQYMLPVADFGDPESKTEQEVTHESPPPAGVAHVAIQQDYWIKSEDGSSVTRKHVVPRTSAFTPCHEDCPVPVDQLQDCRETITCSSGQTSKCVVDNWRTPSEAHQQFGPDPWSGETRFQIRPPPVDEYGAALSEWKPKHRRQVRSHARSAQLAIENPRPRVSDSERFGVIEVFSPPRFALECATKGISCLSADLLTDWDFRRSTDRTAMRELIRERPPELLILCPPCTWAGGWYELNKMYLSEAERREREVLTRLFLNFSAELAELQLAAGKRVLFEHPRHSKAWKLPRFQSLASRMHTVELDMCCYGLRVPGGNLIHKATRLLVSHQNMCQLAKKCPGERHPDHRQHQVVQGSFRGQSVSKLAGAYSSGFVRAVMRTAKIELSRFETFLIQSAPDKECLMAARVAELNDQKKEQTQASLRKLHTNLGHPSNSALVRVLKNGGANQAALDLAREFKCPICEAHKPPAPAHHAQAHRVTEFNKRVSIDVKYLPGWLPNQKIPALNIVDYASSFQVMVPLPGTRETAESVRKAFQERWVTWAGVPSEIVVDPSQTNLSQALTAPQELAGSLIDSTAAEAHWQLGKVEVHGGWFARVLEKVIAECAPNSRESWSDCVIGAHSKNELIQVYGMTPAQFIFGRNPKIAQDLLNEPLELIPATAPLYEESIARAVSIRQAARKAVIELQDDKALRLTLASRPRKTTLFQAGDPVAYWRTQKSNQGVIIRGGKWYGPAVVLGYVGQNLVVIHKKQVFRCAPEQVRPASSEERSLMNTPHLELMGIKDLIQDHQLSRQYVDLVPEGPPPEDPVLPPAQPDPIPQSLPVENSAQAASPPPTGDVPSTEADNFQPLLSAPSEPSAHHAGFTHETSVPYGFRPSSDPPSEVDSGYGPVRRVSKKSSPNSLFRPQAMLADDFRDMMQEMVPKLLSQALDEPQDASVSRGTKREASSEPSNDSSVKRHASAESSAPSEPSGVSLAQFEYGIHQCDSIEALQEFEALCVQCDQHSLPVEMLVAAHINKRAAKEIPETGNPRELQALVDEAKGVEWHTVLGRNAVRVVLGKEADLVRRRFAHRIMGSRFVMTVKQEEDSPARIKGRWCLQGHLDPDLAAKAEAGDLQSPTLSQVGRAVLFQTIASQKWRLRLGDIKGAFLASGALPAQYRPLYASLPQGGIPGVPPDALVEIVGHLYGLNDSPSAWHKCLDQALREVGFTRSKFDPCLYHLRHQGQLVGIYGVHVDDCATGGEGEIYEQALAALRKRFEFRKWRLDDGEFCGARYSQDPQTFAIAMSQEKFAEKIRPIHFSRSRQGARDALLTPDEIRCFRAVNGSLHWLATQSRPDLSTQVSFSQQSFPYPTVGDASAANNAVRRARQHAQMPIVYQPIATADLALMCHSDAAYANGRDGATQAGYLISFTSKGLDKGEVCHWTPAYWRSHRLPRVVNSTLSAEAQSMSAATGMLEWMQLLLAETIEGPMSLRAAWSGSHPRTNLVLTDCKSLYDHLQSKSSPTLEDKRCALDIVIIRESLSKLQTSLRWLPTDRMLADSLTKESPEAMDLLRACLRAGKYQVSDEDTVLEWRASERVRRKDRSRVDA